MPWSVSFGDDSLIVARTHRNLLVELKIITRDPQAGESTQQLPSEGYRRVLAVLQAPAGAARKKSPVA